MRVLLDQLVGVLHPAMVLSQFDTCRAEELATPYYIFKDAGFEITIASIKGGVVRPHIRHMYLLLQVVLPLHGLVAFLGCASDRQLLIQRVLSSCELPALCIHLHRCACSHNLGVSLYAYSGPRPARCWAAVVQCCPVLSMWMRSYSPNNKEGRNQDGKPQREPLILYRFTSTLPASMENSRRPTLRSLSSSKD